MRHTFTAMSRKQKITAAGVCLLLLAVAFYVYMGSGKQQEGGVRRELPEVQVQEIQPDCGRCQH